MKFSIVQNDCRRRALTIAEAANVAGYSQSWVRDRIHGLSLATIDDGSGVTKVDADDLARLLSQRRRPKPQRRLRLVVDNSHRV